MGFIYISETSSPSPANASSTNSRIDPIILDSWCKLDPTLYFKEHLMSGFHHIPEDLTQAQVEASVALKSLQQDLLVLTSFGDNSSLHWRPSWFSQGPYADKLWTLQNPPNVVTEYYRPSTNPGYIPNVFTRRMRKEHDPEPAYVKSWEHWLRYCEASGVPKNFLDEDMVRLLRLGLMRDGNGQIVEPPTFPLYPEPQPRGRGRYLLEPDSHQRLPTKFHDIDEGQVIVVHSTGQLEVVESDPYYHHPSQWTHFNGNGGYEDDYWYDADPDARKKFQGKGRRWSYLPWTKEQESSCRPFTLKLKMNMSEPRETDIVVKPEY